MVCCYPPRPSVPPAGQSKESRVKKLLIPSVSRRSKVEAVEKLSSSQEKPTRQFIKINGVLLLVPRFLILKIEGGEGVGRRNRVSGPPSTYSIWNKTAFPLGVVLSDKVFTSKQRQVLYLVSPCPLCPEGIH